jgi:uncharacterized protein YgiM (DUF1202 family)
VSPALGKILRAVAAVVVLGVLLIVVQGWVREYRTAPEPPAQQAEPASSTTGTPEGAVKDGATRSDGAAPSEGDGSGTTKASDAEPAKADSTTTKNKRIVVLVDGLNLRLEPVATGAVVRGLKADETLVVLRKKGDWYYVRTASGSQGWISSNPSYTRAAKK